MSCLSIRNGAASHGGILRVFPDRITPLHELVKRQRLIQWGVERYAEQRCRMRRHLIHQGRKMLAEIEEWVNYGDPYTALQVLAGPYATRRISLVYALGAEECEPNAPVAVLEAVGWQSLRQEVTRLVVACRRRGYKPPRIYYWFRQIIKKPPKEN